MSDVFTIDPHICQTIVNEFYLTTLAGEKKTDPRDGRLTRKIHGAMHAIRAQFYIIILHEMMKIIYKEYVEQSCAGLHEYLDLSEKQTIELVRHTALFHDSGRAGEDQDIWEGKSASNFREYLTEKFSNTSPLVLQVFGAIIEYKDKAETYNQMLGSCCKRKDDDDSFFSAFQYIRKLLYWADCLDIMRCVSRYSCDNFFQEFADIPTYGLDKKQPFIELIDNIFCLLEFQQDMLFPCKIFNSEEFIKESKGSFNPSKKVRYEHSSNVYNAILQDLLKNCFFYKYIKDYLKISSDERIILSIKHDVFNPFIHGSCGAILSTLKRSNFSLLGAMDMIEVHHAAPMGGEIILGGYDSFKTCGVCFGIFYDADKYRPYNLERIIDDYALRKNSHVCPDITRVTSEFVGSYEHGVQDSFNNINIIIIYMVRALQLISSAEREDLLKKILILENTINLQINVLKLLAKLEELMDQKNLYCLLVPDDDEGETTNQYYKQKLKIEKLTEHLKTLEVRPDIDSNISVVSFFNDFLNIFFKMEKREFFKFKNCILDEEKENYIVRETNGKLPRGYTLFPKNFEGFLVYSFSDYRMPGCNDFFNHIPIINRHCERLREYCLLIQKLKCLVIPFSSEEIKWLQRGYNIPMVFMYTPLSDGYCCMYSYNLHSGEYRTSSPIEIGSPGGIDKIATDTQEHCEVLLDFFREHKRSMKITTFAELEKAYANGQHPEFPYTCSSSETSISASSSDHVLSQRFLPSFNREAPRQPLLLT